MSGEDTRSRSIAKMAEIIATELGMAMCRSDNSDMDDVLTDARDIAEALAKSGVGWAGALSENDRYDCASWDEDGDGNEVGGPISLDALARAFGQEQP